MVAPPLLNGIPVNATKLYVPVMKVRDILTPDPQCISPGATLTEAAQTMKLFGIHFRTSDGIQVT